MADSLQNNPKRIRKEKIYRSFVLQKRLKAKSSDLKSARQLLKESLLFFKKHFLCFLVLQAVFLVFIFLVALSASQTSPLSDIQTELHQRYGQGWQADIYIAFLLLPQLGEFVMQRLAQSSGWFFTLNLFISLAFLYLIRQLQNTKHSIRTRVKEAVYFGPAQIVPFTLLILILFTQVLPALVVSDFALQLREDGVLDNNLEHLLTLLVVGSIFMFTLYWLVAGFFSLIIVSLPGASPFKAWQTALQLVHRRRWPIIAKLLLFAISAVLVLNIALLPFLWLIPQWADYVFYVFVLTLLALAHIYIFLLYENLLTAKTLRDKS